MIEITERQKFMLSLLDKTYGGTLTSWYFSGGDLYGNYAPSNFEVVYAEQYIERILDDYIVILKEIDSYILLGNPHSDK